MNKFTTISPYSCSGDEEGHIVRTQGSCSHLWRKYEYANEYWKLLEPPTKQKKVSKGRRIDVIYGQCNKLGHSKECCHWNPNNSNNKLKDKKEVEMNGVPTQPGDTWNKSDNKRGHRKANKCGSIIYHSFTNLLKLKFMVAFVKMQLRQC